MATVVQLSDLHVAEPGFRGFGGMGPDTGESWTHTVDQLAQNLAGPVDRVVITGDITQDGTIAQGHLAARRLAELPLPVNVLTGNHDYQIPIEATVPSATVAMNRAERVGPWLFVSVDTNWMGLVDGEGREVLDHPARHEAAGDISPGELAWVESLLDASDAPYVWLWMHHTPGAPGTFARSGFTATCTALLQRHPSVRGIGSGHVHCGLEIELAGRPVYVCPSQSLNFDIEHWCTMPPGYRVYEFGDDGSVSSRVEWTEVPGFAQRELPACVIASLKGDITLQDMMAQLQDV